MIDRKDKNCDCKNDCEMVHFFSTLQREPFNDQSTETRPQNWFDKGNNIRPPSGILANYLIDPANIFSSQLAKNITKLANNLSSDVELADKRFEEVIITHELNSTFATVSSTFKRVRFRLVRYKVYKNQVAPNVYLVGASVTH